MKGDANEFMKRIKGSLLEEAREQRCDNNDDDNDLKKIHHKLLQHV